MIIAFYIPEELADLYRKERFQPTLARLKCYAKQAGTPADLKIVQQLEASFCVSREIVNVNGGVPFVGPGFPGVERWQVQDAKEGRR
jgi:hypothetical protein